MISCIFFLKSKFSNIHLVRKHSMSQLATLNFVFYPLLFLNIYSRFFWSAILKDRIKIHVYLPQNMLVNTYLANKRKFQIHIERFD